MALLDPNNSALSKLGYSLDTNFYQLFLDRASGVAKDPQYAEVIEHINDSDMTDDELEEFLKKQHLGDSNTDITTAFEGMPRTAENNYGYIDKPGIMSFAGMLPGVAGLIGAAANLFTNISNVSAVNAARKDLGLEPLTVAETIKGAVLGISKVGQVEVDGKKVNVDLDPDKQKTDKKGIETVTAQTAKAFKDTVDIDNANKAEVIGSTKSSLPAPAQGFVDVNQGPMTSSPAGGARAASGIGIGQPTGAEIQASASSNSPASVAKGMEALAPNGLLGSGEISFRGTSEDRFGKAQPETQQMAGMIAGQQPQGITVTSSHRTQAENKVARGAKDSEHVQGKALDISTRGMTDEQKAQLVEDARTAGASRIIGYSNKDIVHVDLNTNFNPNTKNNDVYAMWDGSARNMSKAAGWFSQGLNQQTNPTPTSRQNAVDTLTAQALSNPVGQGFLGSPEVSSSRPNATDLAQEPTMISSEPVNMTGFGIVGQPTSNTIDPTANIDQSRFGPTEDSFFDDQPTTISPDIDSSRFGPTGTTSEINETFDENRVGYPAPTTLSTETYGDKLGLWSNSAVNPQDLTNVTPAQYAALGFVDRTPEQISAISQTLAGELSPRSLQDLTGVNGVEAQREAQTELANMIATIENREASGKFSNVLTSSQYNSNLPGKQDITAQNYSIYGQVLDPLVQSYYTPEGIKASNYAATHYYNPQVVTPEWSNKMTNVETVGKHTFGTLDSKYDVPVPESFKSEVAGTQLGLMGDNVPTPTSAYSASVGDTGKGFVGSPEAQTSVATPMTDAMSTDLTPSIDVDSGKAFGESFGGSAFSSPGFDSQVAGATTENRDSPFSVDASIAGEQSFGGFSAGSTTDGPGPGVTGTSEDAGLAGGFMGGESDQEGPSGGISAFSGITGEDISDWGGSTDSSSGSDSSGSLSDSLSDAFGGWGGSDDSDNDSGN